MATSPTTKKRPSEAAPRALEETKKPRAKTPKRSPAATVVRRVAASPTKTAARASLPLPVHNGGSSSKMKPQQQKSSPGMIRNPYEQTNGSPSTPSSLNKNGGKKTGAETRSTAASKKEKESPQAQSAVNDVKHDSNTAVISKPSSPSGFSLLLVMILVWTSIILGGLLVHYKLHHDLQLYKLHHLEEETAAKPTSTASQDEGAYWKNHAKQVETQKSALMKEFSEMLEELEQDKKDG